MIQNKVCSLSQATPLNLLASLNSPDVAAQIFIIQITATLQIQWPDEHLETEVSSSQHLFLSASSPKFGISACYSWIYKPKLHVQLIMFHVFNLDHNMSNMSLVDVVLSKSYSNTTHWFLDIAHARLKECVPHSDRIDRVLGAGSSRLCLISLFLYTSVVLASDSIAIEDYS